MRASDHRAGISARQKLDPCRKQLRRRVLPWIAVGERVTLVAGDAWPLCAQRTDTGASALREAKCSESEQNAKALDRNHRPCGVGCSCRSIHDVPNLSRSIAKRDAK